MIGAEMCFPDPLQEKKFLFPHLLGALLAESPTV